MVAAYMKDPKHEYRQISTITRGRKEKSAHI